MKNTLSKTTLKKIHGILCRWVKDPKTIPKNNTGICNNLYLALGYKDLYAHALDEALIAWFRNWPLFSGYEKCPVLNPEAEIIRFDGAHNAYHAY